LELQKAQQLAIKLMNKHGLTDKGWVFKYDKAKKRFGCCWHLKKTISLSAPLTLLRESKNIRNTVLHEIAHALVGCGHGHDHVWRAKALEIGCNGNRCSSDVKLKGNWEGVCPNGHISYKHRKPRLRISCGVCKPKMFDANYLITYELKPIYSIKN
jgi:predicted SprT family Zn-dependent metalloprotease